jgi:hypothetical protein
MGCMGCDGDVACDVACDVDDDIDDDIGDDNFCMGCLRVFFAFLSI